MKKRTIWTLIALLINLSLLPLVLSSPAEAAAERSKRSLFFPCCEESTAGDAYCCDGCCIFTWNCLRHDTCGNR